MPEIVAFRKFDTATSAFPSPLNTMIKVSEDGLNFTIHIYCDRLQFVNNESTLGGGRF